jgi:hypothetical protein
VAKECAIDYCRCRCVNCRSMDRMAIHCWKHKTKCHVGCTTTLWERRRAWIDKEWARVPIGTEGGSFDALVHIGRLSVE